MTTEQINLRLDRQTVAALERLAESQSLDRSVVVRRMLQDGIQRWQRNNALASYQRGDISIGRAAEEAGISVWEAIALAREAGVAHPIDIGDVDADLDAFSSGAGRLRADGNREATLADLPPEPGGVLLVGINPALKSVDAGHYYQGALGRRLWRRLERLALLADAEPGAEDIAFTRMGHGLTDVVKRPTKAARDVTARELELGAALLRDKVGRWQPGLVLFVFKQAAASVLQAGDIRPGPGPMIGTVPTFLLTGPYASVTQTEAIDRQLAGLLGAAGLPATGAADAARAVTQRVTARDIAAGQIRLPVTSKQLLPWQRGKVEIVLRGRRLEARYDPRTASAGDGRERSGRISLPASDLADLVEPDERLRVSRDPGGVIKLD